MAEREKLTLSPVLEGMMDYCEYAIQGDFNKNSKSKNKSKKKKREVTNEFREAFKSLNRD